MGGRRIEVELRRLLLRFEELMRFLGQHAW